jgi:hypothetical protein
MSPCLGAVLPLDIGNSSTGFIVGCSPLRLGLLKSSTVVCERSLSPRSERRHRSNRKGRARASSGNPGDPLPSSS